MQVPILLFGPLFFLELWSLAEGYAMWYLKVSQAPGCVWDAVATGVRVTERDKAGSYFRDKSISLGLFRRRKECRRERETERTTWEIQSTLPSRKVSES
ncbi:hypothetical protein BDP67DRAFT_509632 [Colletotrichum lupini]|nr:hypothetical protein BDP67DRAFT_509632 [Colletotrichum lupini]